MTHEFISCGGNAKRRHLNVEWCAENVNQKYSQVSWERTNKRIVHNGMSRKITGKSLTLDCKWSGVVLLCHFRCESIDWHLIDFFFYILRFILKLLAEKLLTNVKTVKPIHDSVGFSTKMETCSLEMLWNEYICIVSCSFSTAIEYTFYLKVVAFSQPRNSFYLPN